MAKTRDYISKGRNYGDTQELIESIPNPLSVSPWLIACPDLHAMNWLAGQIEKHRKDLAITVSARASVSTVDHVAHGGRMRWVTDDVLWTYLLELSPAAGE